MTRFLTELAQTLDSWADSGRAVITETATSVVVGGLRADDATALLTLVSGTPWTTTIEDAAEATVSSKDINEDFEPFKVALGKPSAPAGITAFVTNTAFLRWLISPTENTTIWLGRLETPFETFAARFAPWNDLTTFSPTPTKASPRKIVRDSSAASQVPAEVSLWLLKSDQALPWKESASITWANAAAYALFQSLANELEAGETIMFRGPPVVRYSLSTNAADAMSVAGFSALQQAARWVFQDERDAETRHGLLAAELARTNVASSDAVTLFEKGSASALEGARIALQLGLHKLSLDALKAMADLRKAVADETVKLSDATRQLATAVAGALFAGVGIIAARLTMSINGPIVSYAVLVLGFVIAAYVAAVILNGCQFVSMQKDLRLKWRERLYRYLPDAEYKIMVSDPADKAENAFKTASQISGLLALLLLAAVALVTFAPASLLPAKTDSQKSISAPAPSSPEKQLPERH